MMIEPPGMLRGTISHCATPANNLELYLSQKTHRQLVPEVIAPPAMGPKMLAHALEMATPADV